MVTYLPHNNLTRLTQRRQHLYLGVVVEHHGSGLIFLEADALVEPLLVGGHQVNALHPAHVGMALTRVSTILRPRPPPW